VTFRGSFLHQKWGGKLTKGTNMKQRKNNMVGVKLNDSQTEALDKMIDGRTIKNRSQAIQYLINQKLILG